MKKLTIITLLALLTLCGCQKLEIDKDAPKCIDKEIKDFQKTYACEDGAQVDEFTFQGKAVYAFGPGNCGADMQTFIKDADCNDLGALGGIMGNTQINGESFSNAVFVKTIWKN